jgi:hypothetical protein
MKKPHEPEVANRAAIQRSSDLDQLQDNAHHFCFFGHLQLRYSVKNFGRARAGRMCRVIAEECHGFWEDAL